MVRQAHHERNQQVTVRPEPVGGLDQRFLSVYRLGNTTHLTEIQNSFRKGRYLHCFQCDVRGLHVHCLAI